MLMPAPNRKTISFSWSSARSTITCMAAQGSSAAPDFPESLDLLMASGFNKVPLRPINSERSVVKLRFTSSVSKKATLPANSVL